ncbi:hypothetical protein [Klebsiella quasipneumoniae]|uniref:hypothetical protein n=1 Tax=Klebsiella quasipneumoniae TaxID=1463165 RepID=UPI00388F5B1C
MLNMIVRLLADKMEFERVNNNLTLWQRFKQAFGFLSEEPKSTDEENPTSLSSSGYDR